MLSSGHEAAFGSENPNPKKQVWMVDRHGIVAFNFWGQILLQQQQLNDL
jgi:hypothetical protein